MIYCASRMTAQNTRLGDPGVYLEMQETENTDKRTVLFLCITGVSGAHTSFGETATRPRDLFP